MRAQLSFVLSQITLLTERRTDRILIARPRLHSMQRGKNGIAGDAQKIMVEVTK